MPRTVAYARIAALAALTVRALSVHPSVEDAAQNYCAACANGGAPPMTPNRLVLQCSSGSTISAVIFAAYGNPTGSCGAFAPGTCNAANSSTIVSSACIGQNQCTVWPNTTTFGDPCFGTVKQLVVQWQCSAGGVGNSTCFTAPAPSPAGNTSAAVVADFSQSQATVSTIPSLQVVSQRLLLPWSGDIYSNAWSALRHLTSLGLQSVRFVPWIPYARMGVAELDPPSGNALCGPRMWALGQVYPFTLDCGADGGTISSIDFASFGNPSGQCGAYSAGTCQDPNSLATVKAACVGQQACTLGPDMFSNNCASVKPYLAVQARCSYPSKQFTYWNFTWVDQLMMDFWGAAAGDGSQPIPNFSTQPSWLYDSNDFSYPDDPTVPWYGYDRGTAPAINTTALGDYYGRLLAWYVMGGFTDEYGAYHASGHALNITMYEVFNEVDYEHGHTPQSYVADYDAVVAGIRRWLGPKAAPDALRFVGLSLPNIDDSDKVQAWVAYFLNQSNHDAAVWDAVSNGFIGFHSYPTSSYGPFTSDPSSFTGMFSYVESLLVEVQAVVKLAASLAPNVRLCLDESGVDMDNVLAGGVAPPNDNPRFWVAGGSYFAYLWSLSSALGDAVHVVAQSQFMDAPGQEPSVSMLDWTTGLGTAKYWVNELLLRTTGSGDVFVATSTNASSTLHAQAFQHAGTDSLLLISKANVYTSVSFTWTGASGSPTGCTALCVDETTGLSPARQASCVLLSPLTATPLTGGTGEGPQGQASATLDMFPYATCVVQLQ